MRWNQVCSSTWFWSFSEVAAVRKGVRHLLAAPLELAARTRCQTPTQEPCQPPPELHSVGGMVRLDLRGNVVALRPQDVEQLRDAAGARAGSSSRSRDLALVLDWALASPRVVVLRRSEAQELERLVREEPGLTDLAATLGAASRAA
jgi:hypothetical protein